jgi:hypothetical protein
MGGPRASAHNHPVDTQTGTNPDGERAGRAVLTQTGGQTCHFILTWLATVKKRKGP